MKIYQKPILFLAFFMSCLHAYGQGEILCDTLPELRVAEGYYDKDFYDSAIVYYAKALEHYERNEDWGGVLYSAYYLQSCYYLLRDYGACENALNEANLFREKYFENNELWKAKILYRYGLLSYKKGDFNKALDFYKEVLETDFLSLKDGGLYAKAYRKIGWIYTKRGDYEKAKLNYNMALSTYSNKSLNRIDSIRLESIYNGLSSLYGYKNEYKNALIHCNQSLNLKKKLYGINNLDVSESYATLSILHFMSEEYEEAEDKIKKSMSIYVAIKGEEGRVVANLLSVRASIYRMTHDYEKSEETYLYLINMVKRVLGENHNELIAHYNNYAVLKLDMKQYDEALLLFNKAVELTKLNFNDKHPFFVEIYQETSKAYMGLNDYKTAQKYLNKSREIASLPKDKDELQLGNIAFTAAKIKQHENQYQSALADLEHARKLYNEVFSPKNHHFTQCFLEETKIYLKQRNYDDGLVTINEAINSMLESEAEISNTETPDVTKSISPFYLKDGLELKGDYYLQLYGETQTENHLKLALDNYDKAIEILNKNRTSRRSESSKLKLSEDANIILKKALPIAFQLHEITGEEAYKNKVFEYSEYNKALVLLSALSKLKAEQIADMPDSLATLEKQLRKEKGHLKKDIHYEFAQGENANLNTIDSLRNEVYRVSDEYDRLMNSIEQNYPKYYDLKYNVNIVSVTDVQKNIDPGQVLLEYFIADEDLYIIRIDKTDFDIMSVGIDESFATLTKEMTGHIQKQDFKGYTDVAQKLYDILIRPIKEQISDKRLVIIPDGVLNLLPFDLLLAAPPKPNSTNYASQQYLLNEHPITYNYSATLYDKSLRPTNHGRKKSFLGIAPSFSGTKLSEINRQIMLRNELIPLPGALDEVNGIKELLNGDVLVKEDATEGNFKDIAPDYQLIHLATHALLDDSDPMYSKLLLPADTISGEDGFLHIYELYNMKIEADVVALSACNTGVGEVKNGEGVMTLSRGISYAGCDNTVMTLWSVGDRSTARMMDKLYKQLKEPIPKDVALQRAKLDFLTTGGRFTSAPLFWGGIIFVGNPETLESSPPLAIWMLIGIPILLGMVLLGRRLRRQKTDLPQYA